MKKILIIGAGIGQINIVKLAQEMGLYVIVVSPKGYPAIEIADELFECDIFDYDRIVEYGREKHIDAVISDQNDLMVPTVAFVAEKLNLPGLTYNQALLYCDKNKFRAVCRAIGVPVPESISVTDTKVPYEFQVPLPWIVKPSDSQSSIGVTKIEKLEDYEQSVSLALEKSKQNTAIVERFFLGEEYVCEGFVYKGKYYNLSFGDRRYFQGTLIPCQTLFPSTLDHRIQENIIKCESLISKYIEAPFGIIHSEYLVNKETGKFIIVESAIRGGGVYISSHLIPLATGINVNKLLIQCALGENIDINQLKNKNVGASAYVCFTLPEGVVMHIEGVENLSNIEGVKMVDIRNLEEGQVIEQMKFKGQRKGPIIISGKNRDCLDDIINIIKLNINIDVIKDGQILNAIWN